MGEYDVSGIPENAKRISPGFYATPDGTLHVDLEEFVVAAGGNPNSERDRMTAVTQIQRVVGGEGIPTEVRLKP